MQYFEFFQEGFYQRSSPDPSLLISIPALVSVGRKDSYSLPH